MKELIKAGSGKKKKQMKVQIKYKKLLSSYSLSFEKPPNGIWPVDLWMAMAPAKLETAKIDALQIKDGWLTKDKYYRNLLGAAEIPDIGLVIDNIFKDSYYLQYYHKFLCHYYFFGTDKVPGVAIGQLTIPKLEDYKNKWPVEGTDDYKQNPDNFGLNLIIKKNKKSKYVTAVLFIPLSRHDSRIPDETKEEYCHIFNLDYLTKGDVIFKYWDICRTETNIEKSIRNAIKVYGDNRIK